MNCNGAELVAADELVSGLEGVGIVVFCAGGNGAAGVELVYGVGIGSTVSLLSAVVCCCGG